MTAPALPPDAPMAWAIITATGKRWTLHPSESDAKIVAGRWNDPGKRTDYGPDRPCRVVPLYARPEAPPVAPTVEAAIAALDVEAVVDVFRHLTRYDILGLADVRAAHRAEVERAVAEALGAVVPDWLPESTDEAVAAVRECADEIATRLMRGAAAIRARGAKS